MYAKRFGNALRTIGLAIATAICAAGLGHAFELEHAGVTIELPGEWSSSKFEGEGVVLDAVSGGARITVASCPERIAISPLHRDGLDRELRARLAQVTGIDAAAVRSLSVSTIDGLPAFRIRLSLSRRSGTVEQVVYVLGAQSTIVLAFSAPSAEFVAAAPGFERAAAHATVKRGALFGMTQSASCGILGIWSVVGYLLRLVLRRGRGVLSGAS